MPDPESTPTPNASDESWLLLECPGCGVSVKTASDHVGKTLKCPSCGAFVEFKLKDDEKGGKTEGDHPFLQSQDLELLPFTDESDEQATEGFKGLITSDQPSSARRSKRAIRDKRSRKRMKTQEEELKWDVIEAVKSSRGDYFEYIDPRTGESHKVRRREETEGAEGSKTQTLVKNLASLAVLLLLTGVVALVASGFFKSAEEGIKDSSEINEEGPVAALKDGEKLINEGIPPIAIQEELDICLRLANEFYAAAEVEERVRFVRQPDRVRPLMEDWYAANGRTQRSFSEVFASDKFIDNGRYFIRLALRFSAELRDIQFVCFEQTEREKFLLDWESSEGYQEVSLEEFQRKRSVEPFEFRVNAALGDVYTPTFDRGRYQSVTLTYPNKRSFFFHAYIDRSSEFAPNLISRLELTSKAPLILAIAYSSPTSPMDTVLIKELVSTTWFL